MSRKSWCLLGAGIIIILVCTAVILQNSDQMGDSKDETPNDYLITYDLNGGSGNTPPSEYSKTPYTIGTTEEPTRPGYKFTGWSKTQNSDSGSNYGESVWISSDTVLYAAWMPTVSGTLEIVNGYSNGFTYTIHGSYSGDYDRTIKPSQGNQFAIYKITIHNNAIANGYSPYYSDYKLKASNGLLYSNHYNSSNFNEGMMGNPSLYDVEIAKGGSYTLYVVYEIPIDAKPVSVSYDRWAYGYAWVWE